jgi:hypothetical protein
MPSVLLIPHPSTPGAPVHRLVASVAMTPARAVALSFRVEGDIDRLRIPPPAEPRRADGLWRRTCFEAFVMAGDGPGYHEINLSPSGAWAAYAFRGYRDGGVLDAELDPEIVVQQAAGYVELGAVIRAECLPRQRAGARLRLGLAAVLEDLDGRLTYWALRHSAIRPDFHRAEGFALDLPPP